VTAIGTIQTLVVDDEKLARVGLRSMLSGDPDLAVRECASGEQAIEAITASGVDLVFLDVQMRGVDGFGVIEAVGADLMPIVVFTTAYDEFALKAFEACALDYLLKPFTEARLAASVARAKIAVHHRRMGRVGGELIALLQGGVAAGSSRVRKHSFLVRTAQRTYRVEGDDVDRLESADNYTRLWTGTRSHLIRETLSHLESTLAGAGFIRVHRHAIVNIARVTEVRGNAQGGFYAVLDGGHRVPVSRVRRNALVEALRMRTG
jgi:two-component system LytT family response regulator